MRATRRSIAAFLAAITGGVAFIAPVRAEIEVDLELVLLADATGSIDEDEIRFQRQGYAEAIADPAVLRAIGNGLLGKIAVTYIEWADASSQQIVADWTVIDGPDSARTFADAILAPPRLAYGRNAIGAALLFGKSQIDGNAYSGLRKVIDLSADSANNWNGPSIFEARQQIVDAGMTINGLAVLCRSCSGQPISYDLEQAFKDTIIGGPGAFVVTAENAQEFAQAVRRKLVLEITGLGTAGNWAAREGASAVD